MESRHHVVSRRLATQAMFFTGMGLCIAPGIALAQSRAFDPARPFTWQTLLRNARELSTQPFTAPAVAVQAATEFDAFGALAYGKAKRFGKSIRLFPAARNIAEKPVELHLLTDGMARKLIDQTGMFVGGENRQPAGFRVMRDTGDADWLAFLGASYFRTSGQENQYGLSARAVAIDTALADEEEFPAFTAFWIEEHGPDHVQIYALLDGPSLTGACSFDCRLTDDGVEQDAQISLFLRRSVERLGIAPLTSMFWYDQKGPKADWRPEVHDSDGLVVHFGSGERIWRPLEVPTSARTTSFKTDNLRGFGLLQRDRHFEDYQDDGAFYNRRPSLWVKPLSDWGKGQVMLYEMPTASETQDNVVAFWVADEAPKPGKQHDFAYRLHWTSEEPDADVQARCVDSFEGPAGRPGAPGDKNARKYIFDFQGPTLQGKTRQSGITAITDLPSEAVSALAAYPVVGKEATWRVMLDLRQTLARNPEFRVHLADRATVLSETVVTMIAS